MADLPKFHELVVLAFVNHPNLYLSREELGWLRLSTLAELREEAIRYLAQYTRLGDLEMKIGSDGAYCEDILIVGVYTCQPAVASDRCPFDLFSTTEEFDTCPIQRLGPHSLSAPHIMLEICSPGGLNLDCYVYDDEDLNRRDETFLFRRLSDVERNLRSVVQTRDQVYDILYEQAICLPPEMLDLILSYLSPDEGALRKWPRLRGYLLRD
jgi:hypothetical protein